MEKFVKELLSFTKLITAKDINKDGKASTRNKF